MSVRRLDPNQPDSFDFTEENLAWSKILIARYPEGKEQSAVIPLLWRAQEQNGGWISEPAIRKVADMLGMAHIRVLEIATFYTMFQLSPVGAIAHIQVCGTTPCMLRGSEDLIKVCKKRIANAPHTLSDDGNFSWEEVECLGACTNAPMIQVGKDVYEDLDIESFEAILDAFERGEKPKTGPQNGRQFSAPLGGPTSLTDPAIYENSEPAGGSVVQTQPSPAADTAQTGKASEATGEAAVEQEGEKPEILDAPRNGQADDLKKISGIGPGLEKKLNENGIYHFDQIAAWTPANVAWAGELLSFKGRIEREDWLSQARILAKGEDTEFSRRTQGGAGAAATASDNSGSDKDEGDG